MYTIYLIIIASFFILVYTFLGYPLLLMIFSFVKSTFTKKIIQKRSFPSVSLIITAWNEEQFIEKKIVNSLQLDYPKDKLSIYVISDGSTDNTNEIVSRYKEVKLFFQEERKGKTAAMNRVMKFVTSDIVVFTDANTLVNKEAIQNIIVHFNDAKIACVAGEKRVINENNTTSAGESLYWKFESFLKRKDAQLYSATGAAGELFALRTSLYIPIPDDTILDDFTLSLQLIPLGYKIAYEANAYACEQSSINTNEEWKRKVRIAGGGFQAIWRLKSLFKFWKHPIFTFQYFSHRVIRWTLSPLALICLLLVSLIAIQKDINFSIIFLLQFGFYTLAFIGWLNEKKDIHKKLFYIPYYFTMMHLAVIVGFINLFNKQNKHIWERSVRKQLPI